MEVVKMADYDMSENKNKGGGWFLDSRRHALSAKGIKNAKRERVDRELGELRELSEQKELTWKDFEEICGTDAEKKLQKLIDENRVEFDGYELEEEGRKKRYGEGWVEVKDGNEVKTVILERDTPITLLSY